MIDAFLRMRRYERRLKAALDHTDSSLHPYKTRAALQEALDMFYSIFYEIRPAQPERTGKPYEKPETD